MTTCPDLAFTERKMKTQFNLLVKAKSTFSSRLKLKVCLEDRIKKIPYMVKIPYIGLDKK